MDVDARYRSAAVVRRDGGAFGEHLLARRLVTRGTLARALTLQLGTGRPLGELAVSQGLMTMKGVCAVLAAQEGLEGHRLFGALALQLGHLDHDDLERLLELQRDTRKPLGRVLVDMGALTPQQLADEEARFAGPPERVPEPAS